MSRCAKCTKVVDRYGDTLFCSGSCKGVFHLHCTDLDLNDYIAKKQNKSIDSWQCSSCFNTKNFDYSELNAKLDAIINSQVSIKESLSSINDKLDALQRDNEVNKTRLAALESRCDNFEAQLTTINMETSSTSNLNNVITAITINEITERQLKAANIIFYNVNELKSNSKVDQNAHDLSEANILIKLLLDKQIENIKTVRLGRPVSNPTRPRPLRITLPSLNDVADLFKNKSKLTTTNYKMSSDLTIMQREELKQLRRELETRTSNGESLTIKYVNKMPKIVNITSKKN